MANTTAIYSLLAVGVIGGGVWYYQKNQDKTPVGLVVINQLEGGGMPMGETSDGKAITANALEGTWRESEDSISVASESAEKPLVVVYHDGKPIHAEVIAINEWYMDAPGMDYPDECRETPPCETMEEGYDTEECWGAWELRVKETTKKWIALAKEHGATDESIAPLENVVNEESTAQEAESIFGPTLSIQSHAMW